MNATITKLVLPISQYKPHPYTQWEKEKNKSKVIDPLSDDWEEYGDGCSWLYKGNKLPLIGEAKPTKILDEKSQKQKDYLEAITLAKELKNDCDIVHIKDMTNAERMRVMKDIDDIIALMNICSQDLYTRETTMVCKLKDELIAHRLNILPEIQHIATTSEQIEMAMNIQSLYEREGY